MEQQERDYITVMDQQGHERKYAVEALFDMEDQSYALLHSEEETLLMRIEGSDDDQYLIGIDNPDERDAVLNAYQIAVESAPAE